MKRVNEISGAILVGIFAFTMSTSLTTEAIGYKGARVSVKASVQRHSVSQMKRISVPTLQRAGSVRQLNVSNGATQVIGDSGMPEVIPAAAGRLNVSNGATQIIGDMGMPETVPSAAGPLNVSKGAVQVIGDSGMPE